MTASSPRNCVIKILTLVYFSVLADGVKARGSHASKGTAVEIISAAQQSDPLATLPWDDGLIQDDLRKLLNHVKTGSRRQHRTGTPELKHPHMDIHIDVVLVGFDGEGFGKIHVSADKLLKQLHTLQLSPDIEKVTHTQPLTTKVRYKFKTRLAPHHITDEIAGAIKLAASESIKSATTSRKDTGGVVHAEVSHHIVESVLSRFTKISKPASHVVYFLNPESPGSMYSYLDGDQEYQRCGRTTWAGQGFIWTDIRAGPVSFGPRDNEQVQGQDYFTMLLNTDPNPPPKHIVLSQLASFVAAATRQLIAPPLHHVLPAPSSQLNIHVFHIYDMEPVDRNPSNSPSNVQLDEDLKKVLFPGQKLQVSRSRTILSECDVCVAALMSARQTASSVRRATVISLEHNFLSSSHMHQVLTKQKTAMFEAIGLPLDAETMSHPTLPVYVFHLTTHAALLFDTGVQAVGFPDMVLGLTTHSGILASNADCNQKAMLLQGSRIQQPITDGVLLSAWGVTPQLNSRTGVAAFAAGNVTRRLEELTDDSFSFRAFGWSHTISTLQVELAQRNVALSAIEQAYNKVEEIYHSLATLAEYVPAYKSELAEHTWLTNITANEGLVAAVEAAQFESTFAHRHKREHKAPMSPDMRAALLMHKMKTASGILKQTTGGYKCMRDLKVILYKLDEAGEAMSRQDYHVATWYAASTAHEVKRIEKFASDYTWSTKVEVVCDSMFSIPTTVVRALVLFGPSALVVALFGKRRRQQKPERFIL